MICLLGAIYLSWVPALVLAALLAGMGQGLGQLGGLSLIGLHVNDGNRAQANAVLSIGGYVPAGLLSVMAGYLIDVVGLAGAVTSFALLLTLTALAGGRWAVRNAGE
ncbi:MULTISPECIES: hypothetical protein [Pandoraea]|uniref:hypothetical protein n=1 Tax=Pandoraea TaxID=93217 RepID=UPI001F5C2D04|nr:MULTISPECIES: hypothetical protein [Pandoraea]